MEEVLKKLRKKFTLTTVAVAAVFLLILFGGFFGLLCVSNESVERTYMEKVLSSSDFHAPFDMQCIVVVVYDDGGIACSPNAEFYKDTIDDIIIGARQKGSGRFRVGSLRLNVESRRASDCTIYAVVDRTSTSEGLRDTGFILAVLYVLSLALVALLGYLFSAKSIEPVKMSLEKQRDLIANASHELKTPLTIISTNLSVIKSEPSTSVEDNDKWISSIDTQVSRMNELIQSMLELSKLEQSVIPKAEFDFSASAEGACLAFEAVCFEKNVRLLTDIQPDIYVFGEKNALERLIIILLDNAVKYCGENGKIGLKLENDGKKARLTVLNTGQSISEEEARHVFDRFYRSDGARKNEDNKSFGLGLSIAQATVIAHGGTINCHGVDGRGTVFEAKIPCVKKIGVSDSKKKKCSDATGDAFVSKRDFEECDKPLGNDDDSAFDDLESENYRGLNGNDEP